jgi:hypothetical protein
MSKLSKLFVLAGLIVGLLAPSAANAAITQVFGTVTCTTQPSGATAGQRWCGNSANTTVPVWDGTPIDVAVGFPAEASPDNNYPIVGIYHGWGGTKITPSSAAAQRWLTKGYAVFSISDRGWGSSCGTPSKPANTLKSGACAQGYIHLLSRRYEVRDVQTLLGKLADEGVINPQEIGATGGSYGGGMSLELGSLKDRVELQNGELIPWESPLGKPMKIAATAPEYPWSDIAQSLQPNGSNLDYVANAPYKGILGNHEFGIEKNNWNASLFTAGTLLGYYAPTSAADPEANLTEWHNFDITGGPYNGKALAVQQEEFLPNHSAYYTNLSEAPAPALMENGWNDDLFPVDQTIDYYNKVRAAYPNLPIQMFDLDLGHNPRSSTTPSTIDTGKLAAAQNTWFGYFLRGEGSEPTNAHGGVTAITSVCPATAASTGHEYKAANWAGIAPGEILLSGAAEQTIVGPGSTAPTQAFTTGNVCSTQAAGDNATAATYKLAAAPAEGFTIVGSSTVVAEFSTPGTNAQVIGRLYDVNVPGGGTQQLIGRAIYRPISPGEGFVKQVFQFHPQAWNVAAGHVLKLELLSQDSTYARTSSTPQSIKVRSLELRVPTTEAPGSDEGLVQAPQPGYLPPSYSYARNERTTTPGAPQLTGGTNPNSTGSFTLSWEPSAAASGLSYKLEQKSTGGSWSTVATGLGTPTYTFTGAGAETEGTWNYRVSASNEGPATAASAESAPIVVDQTAPAAPSASADRAPDYAGGGGWFKDTVTVSFTANGDPVLSDGSAGSGADPSTLSAPQTFNTDGSHTASGTVADKAGNVSAYGSASVQVDVSPPAVEVSCPESVKVDAAASATVTASDDQSGLASDPSGTVSIDTSKAGPVTTTRSATDNVGHEANGSCTTQVGYVDPGAPALSSGANPNMGGLFSLAWTGSDPVEFAGLSYTLQHHNDATGEWSTVATGIEALSYEFAGIGEGEGTWVYRVQGSDPGHGLTTEFSPASSPVVVDDSAPAAPSISADRAPDYAGGGGWFKDSVQLTATSNGDPALTDGSAGSGVDPASIPAPVTYGSSGSFTDTASVEDLAGNTSASTSETVQVDATAPALKVECPTEVALHGSATATVSASDGQSGLASNPSGMVSISTAAVGPQTITRTATDNVGHSTTVSCTTDVRYVFSGLKAGSGKVKYGKSVKVHFKLGDAKNKPVTGAVAQLEIAKVTDEEVGAYETLGTFTHQAQRTYGYTLSTTAAGMSKGKYLLRVSLNDGSRHTVSLTVK